MNKPLNAHQERIGIRNTGPEDLAFVTQAERHPDNCNFVGQWTDEEHLAALDDPNIAHLIIYTIADERRIGYMILPGLTGRYRSLNLKRLVVTEKGQGYGREALKLVKKLAFEELKMHRLWLDVITSNESARHLYRSEGFTQEGITRESFKVGEQYVSQAIMSILEQEYIKTSMDKHGNKRH